MTTSQVGGREAQDNSDDSGLSYAAYGLTIRSEIPLPGLPERGRAGGDADASVVLGEVPTTLDGASWKSPHLEATSTRVLMEVRGVTRILVSDGSQIMVDPSPQSSLEHATTYVMNMGLSALLYQRGDVILHASVIGLGHQAIAFLGYSGRGKSTLATGFSRRGYRILSDDLCVIRNEDNAWMVQPGPERLLLLPDAVDLLDIGPSLSGGLYPGTTKTVVPIQSGATALPLRAAYVLDYGDVSAVKFERIEGVEKIRALWADAYRRNIVRGLGRQTDFYRQAFSVATSIEMIRVVRPEKLFDLDSVLDALESDFSA